MSDLIDRRMAIDALMEQFKRNTTTAIRAKLTIEALPSAQPEIIRCKDCKWSDWYTALDGNRYCYCMETDNGGRKMIIAVMQKGKPMLDIKEYLKQTKTVLVTQDAFDELVKKASAQPEQQWIPCSERLPKPYEYCL